MRAFLVLAWSLFTSFRRDRSSLFFSFLLPVIITAIFGLLNFGGGSLAVTVGVVDEARNAQSGRLVEALARAQAVRLSRGDRDGELRALRRGERDLVLVFPADFGRASTLVAEYENAGRPQQVGIGNAIVARVIDEATFASLGAQPIARLDRQPVDARNLTYVDFLIPGMIAFSVMQLGVFTVTFGIVQQRQTGVLRRLLATPLRPRALLAAHTLVRLTSVAMQVVVLVGLGVVFFRYRPAGTFPEMLAVAILGGATFLTFGFAIAGWARSEDQANPLANLVTLPQAFLSGIWYPRDVLPAWLRPITELLPLSFLADATRQIGTEGLHLWDVAAPLAGLAIWGVVGFALAVRLFRLE